MARVFLLLSVAAVTAACATGPSRDPSAPPPASFYTAAFPSTDMSGALSRVFGAVKQIQVTDLYEVHSFSNESAPTGTDLMSADVRGRAVSTESVSEIRRASAVMISRSATHVLFLTAAHAVFRPDTIVEYVGPDRDVAPDPTRSIRTLSVKRRQTNWVLDLPGSRTFQILAWDEVEDLALIGFRILATDELTYARPMPLRAGTAEEIKPGSFVYLLGYPGGYRMVSRGIATPVDEDERGAFVVDGNWNQGVSGGPILAIRGDDGTLEWVGLARAAAATIEERVAPSAAAAAEQDPRLPYEGPLFLEEALRIQYGVTLSVPMTAIREFLERNRRGLARLGYVVPIL